MRCRSKFLLATVVIASFTGCSRYELEDSYHDSFREMVTKYQKGAEQLMLEDRTLISVKKASELIDVDIEGDPILSNVVVQDSLERRSFKLADFYMSALQNSSQIRVFSDLPLIRETSIQEAQGAFDVNAYVEARYDRSDDPVGSTLTTGGPDRFEEDEVSVEIGARKKVSTGAEVYIAQELRNTDNNSEFFVPNPQSNAQLRIGMVQPLLNGAGTGYNEAIIQIAEIDSEIARNEFVRQAESHLLEINRTYWSLYTARGTYEAKRRALEDAQKVVADLESRTDFDTARSQILRARASEAERRADLVRAEAAVRNAEDRLKALVNDPSLLANSAIEIVPADLPIFVPLSPDLYESASLALQNRPEILQAFYQLTSASVREQMQRNELLPVLNLIVEGYLAGIERDDVPGAWDEQFNGEGPGATVGLRFEFPIGNNSAEARHLRRKLELRQLLSQLQATIETVLLEVKISVREMHTAYRDLVAKYDSMMAAREDLADFEDRREAMFLGAETTAASYLEFLIEAQDRRSRTEEEFLRALATYNVAYSAMQKAQGTFLSYEAIDIERSEDENGLPLMNLSTAAATEAARASAPQ